MPATLIATLGTEPQVVTITLALLRQKGYVVSEVLVVHTDGQREPSLTALTRLNEAWPTLPPIYSHIPLKLIEVGEAGLPLADIESEAGAKATFRTIYSCAAASKRSGHTLHICIAGGRKSMAAFGMATAQLLFDEHDHLWHLVSFGRFLAEKRMLPEPDDQVSLVPIPVIRWSDVPPSLTEVVTLNDPDEAIRLAERRQAASQARQLRQFMEQELTPAEREVVAYTVRHGGSYQQVAEGLGRGRKTIDTQLQAVYRKMESYFGLERVGRATMMALLSAYWRKT
jgi:CRISPR-associated Csx14 family protein